MTPPSPIHPWPLIGSQVTGDFRVFRVLREIKRSPTTGRDHDFYVMDCPNWVNVLALTPKDELVMVEQFRHGTNTIELEVPGGLMDGEDADPIAAAARELREETGYEGSDPVQIGKVAPNPAIMNNTCFSVLFRNCTLQHALDWDLTEDIHVRLIPISEVGPLVARNQIRHSLVLAALFHLDLWRREEATKLAGE